MTITTETAWKRALTILTVGAAGLALAGCSLLGGGTTSTDDGTDAGTAEGDTTDVFTIKVGDCLNDGNIEGTVSEVKKIECSEPHDSEAYASVIMDDGDFPGDAAVEDQAVTDCTSEFNAFVGMDYQESTLDFSYYYPTEDSWAQGDREILCLVVDPAGPATGSLQGAAK